MTDAIEVLRRDHDEVGRLLAELEASADLADAREQELAELSARLEQGRKLASTRPHPGIRPDPEVQGLASRIAGATDRIRDVLAGRNSN